MRVVWTHHAGPVPGSSPFVVPEFPEIPLDVVLERRIGFEDAIGRKVVHDCLSRSGKFVIVQHYQLIELPIEVVDIGVVVTVQANAFHFFPALFPGYDVCHAPGNLLVHERPVVQHFLDGFDSRTDFWQLARIRVVLLLVDNQVELGADHGPQSPADTFADVMIVA